MKPQKHLLLSAVLMTVVGMPALAQQHYVYSATTGTYADLTGATMLQPAYFNTDSIAYFPVDGETYHFFGMPYTMGIHGIFYMSTYGNLAIQDDTSLVIIDGSFGYMDSIDASSSLSYVIEGTPGDQVIKAQWKNLRFSNGQSGNFMNVQIWVYQSSGVIEIHYGPRSANNAIGYTVSNGPQVGIFHSPTDFSTCYEKLWIFGPPSGVHIDSASTFIFKAMNGIPDEHTIYRFTPKTVLGTEEISSVTFGAYPNPTRGPVQIHALPGSYDRLLIIGADGKTVMESGPVNSLNLENLPTGIYHLQWMNGLHIAGSMPIVVQH